MPEIIKKEHSPGMFDKIAATYDVLNQLLSLGMDRRWRKQMLTVLPSRQGLSVLDLATGTAEVPILLMRSNRVALVDGIDLATNMLKIGSLKVKKASLDNRIFLHEGDAERIAYRDDSFDVVTMAFGIRNVRSVETCLNECLRVLRPAGRLIILEFATPTRSPLRQIFQAYTRFILPWIGRASGNTAAYRYLDQTIREFPCGDAFTSMMSKRGFSLTQRRELMLGAVNLYWADKAGRTNDQ